MTNKVLIVFIISVFTLVGSQQMASSAKLVKLNFQQPLTEEHNEEFEFEVEFEADLVLTSKRVHLVDRNISLSEESFLFNHKFHRQYYFQELRRPPQVYFS